MGWLVLYGYTGAESLASETVGLTEAVTKLIGKGIAETATLSDLVAAIAGKRWGETVSLTEALTTSVSNRLSELMGLTEQVTRQVNRLVAQGETVGLSDTVAARKVSPVAVADTVTLTEQTSRNVAIRLAETVALTETVVKSIAKRSVETVALAETVIVTAGERVAEAPGLTEALSALRVSIIGLSETLVLSEDTKRVLSRAIADPVSLVETLGVTASANQLGVFLAGRFISVRDALGRSLAILDPLGARMVTIQ